MQATMVYQPGGPEALILETQPQRAPGPDDARVKIAAAGVNFADIMRRTGRLDRPYPMRVGREAAGVVDAIGARVTDLKVGDRVGWVSYDGAYATEAIIPANRLVKIPEQLSLEDAAAALLQGLTAHYLVRSVAPLQAGQTCLVHAAAGGTGLWLCQIAKLLGARVIGTVGTPAKADLARAHGADEVILYTEQDFVAETSRLTKGEGVQVIYDGVGRDTFLKGFDCLARRGCLALFGAASGAVEPLDLDILSTHGSVLVSRPVLADFIVTQEELTWRANEVLGWVVDGQVKLRIERTYPLSQAADAHRALESRGTTGKLLLIPPADSGA